MPLFEIPLPNGQIVEIEAPEDKRSEVISKARDYFRQSDPEGFAKWNESRPLTGLGSSFVSSARGALGSQISGAAPYAETVGLPGQETLRNLGQTVSGEPALETRGFEGFRDFLSQVVSRPTEAIPAAIGTAAGSLAGSVALPVAAALGVAGLGAGAGLAGAVGLGTSILTGALSSTSELEGLLKNEPNVDPDTARRLAVGVGGLIGAGEGGAAGALISRALGRTLRRETAEGLIQISNRSAQSAAARGTLAGIALEGGSEAVGGAARETTAALASGNFDVANRADRVLLDAALGSIGGGALGGVSGARDPARARAELESRAGYGPQLPAEGETAPVQAEPPEPSLLPPAPTPFSTGEEARQFFASRPEFAPRFDIDDEGAVILANRYQQQDYRDQVNKIRQNELGEFMATKAIRTFEEPDAKGKMQVREVRDGQAVQFMQRILEAAKDPQAGLNIGSFNAQDITNQALARLGPEADAPTKKEIGFVKQQLEALKRNGFLIEGDEGRGTYGVTGRDIETLEAIKARREGRVLQQPGERGLRREGEAGAAEFPGLAGLVRQAPETAQQEVGRRVGEFLGSGEYLNTEVPALQKISQFLGGEYRGLTQQELTDYQAKFGNRPDPTVANLFNDYIGTREKQSQLAAERRRNPELALSPELINIVGSQNAATLQNIWPQDPAMRQQFMREIENAFAGQQARRIEQLTGITAPAGVTTPGGQTELRETVTPAPGFRPTEDPLGTLLGIARAPELQRTAQLQQLLSDPVQGPQLLQRLTQNRSPREVMSWKKWQQLFRENNIPFSEAQGRFVNEQATKLGLVDGIGRLKWRDVDAPKQAPAPQPKAAPPPPAPKAKPKAAPAPKAPPIAPPQLPPSYESNTTVALGKRPFLRGGEIIYQDAKVGIVEHPDQNNGSLRYYFVSNNPNAKAYAFGIDNFVDKNNKPTGVPPGSYLTTEDLTRVVQKIEERRLNLEQLAKDNPAGPFVNEQIVATRSMPKNLVNYGKKLLQELKLTNSNVIFVSKQDAERPGFTDEYKLYGRYNFVRTAGSQSPTTQGIYFSNPGIKDVVIMVDTTRSPEIQMEALAHEIGHYFQYDAFNRAPAATQQAVRDAFQNFLKKAEGQTLGEFFGELRTPARAIRLREVNAAMLNTPFKDIDNSYLRSFQEWFADNVAKWAVTNEVPRGLVEKFFKKIADGYRKIVASFGSQALPDRAVEDFIKGYRDGKILKQSGLASASDADPTIDAQTVQQSLASPHLPTDTNKAHKIVKQAMDDQITGVFKWFSSGIMTMGKVKPALRAASEAMRNMYTRTQEASDELVEMLAPAARLSPESRAKITRVAEVASRTRKQPDTKNLTAEEKTALQGMFDMGQRAFDYLQEAFVMKYFLPDEGKAPAERARLENFWDKHGRVHLWEIPSKELAAASPEGFRKMQEIDRLRNPYYFPQIARGTHFVAAYKKGAGGAKDIVRLIPYTPLNMAQKLRGFADPEKAAIAELRKEFPSAATHTIMERGQQFTNDQKAQKLREQGDFIAEYLQQLIGVVGKNGQQVIAKMQKEIDKASLDRLFRPNQDILRAVTPDNETSYVLDVLPQYAMSVAKIQARRYTQDEWNKSLENLSFNDKNFLNDLRDYATTPTEAFGAARGAAFFMYLGAAVDTALVNATQPFQTTLPMLIRDGGLGASKFLASAYNTVLLNKDLGKLLSGETQFTKATVSKVLKGDEADAVTRAAREGVFSPVYTNESRGQFTAEGLRKAGVKNAPGTARTLNKLTNFLGKPMQAIEEVNRLTTFLAAYRLAKSDPKVIERGNRADNTGYTDPYSYAMGKVFDTQFLTSKEDRAYIQRFSPGAEVATQFMSFPLKMIEQYVRHGAMLLEGIYKVDPFMARAGFVGMMGMVGPLVLLAGVWGLPGADFTKELLEKLAAKLFKGAQNFDADARIWLGGGRFAEAVLRGVPHAYGGASLANRMKIDPVPFQEISPLSIFGMMGPVGGLAEAYLSRMPEYIANGDYWNAAAVVMPRAVGNVIRGANLYVNEEQRTLQGNRMLTPDILRSYNETTNFPAALRQAVGFPAPELVNLREAATLSEEISRQMREPTEKANKELAKYLTNSLDARRDGDMTRAARELEKFRTRVAEIVREQDGKPLDRRINLNTTAIETRAVNDFLGMPSQAIMQRRAPVAMRPEIERQTQALLWRNKPE